MPRPVLVIHPITGQPCYTKHPERLLERNQVYLRDGVLYGRQWEDEPTYWNGSKHPSCLHVPGEVRS